jgi:hypothetical protein
MGYWTLENTFKRHSISSYINIQIENWIISTVILIINMQKIREIYIKHILYIVIYVSMHIKHTKMQQKCNYKIK